MKHQDMLGEMLDSAADRLAAYGYLLTGSQDAGEDLVQDAIVKVFVRQRRLENARAAEAYVRAAMRTLHIDRMRRDVKWRALMPRLVDRRDVERPDDAVGEQDHIGQALSSLGKQERTVVILRFYDDLKVTYIAEQMHLAEGTVKRYLSQALGKLAEVLGDIEGDLERIVVVERKK